MRTFLAIVAALLLCLALSNCGGGSAANTSTSTATTTNNNQPPNISGRWQFLTDGNTIGGGAGALLVNLTQDGETVTASSAANVEAATCEPNGPTGCAGLKVVPCSGTVSGTITSAGGINTLTVAGCPGTGTLSSFTSTINAAGTVGTNVNGYQSPASLKGTYQGSVQVALFDPGENPSNPFLGNASVPISFSITEGTNNSLTAIMTCNACSQGLQSVTFSGTVVGGGFHATGSSTGGNPAVITLDAQPQSNTVSGAFIGLIVTINGLGYQFFGIPLPLNSNFATFAGSAYGAVSFGP